MTILVSEWSKFYPPPGAMAPGGGSSLPIWIYIFYPVYFACSVFAVHHFDWPCAIKTKWYGMVEEEEGQWWQPMAALVTIN